MSDMTHSPEWHDSCKWVTWLICTWVVTYWYVWRHLCDLLYSESSPRIPTRNHFQFVRKSNIDTIIKTGRIQMCIYLCVCMCIYIYIYIFTLAYECDFIYICVYRYMCTYVVVSPYLCTHIFIFIFTCGCIHVHNCVCIDTNLHSLLLVKEVVKACDSFMHATYSYMWHDSFTHVSDKTHSDARTSHELVTN